MESPTVTPTARLARLNKAVKMNGWRRLFIVFCATLSIPALAYGLLNKPSANEYVSAYPCEAPYGVTPADARQALATNSYKEQSYATGPHCLKFLESVADGSRHRAEMDSWKSNFVLGAELLGAFFAAIYAFGAAAGWVWRGFRPGKP